MNRGWSPEELDALDSYIQSLPEHERRAFNDEFTRRSYECHGVPDSVVTIGHDYGVGGTRTLARFRSV